MPSPSSGLLLAIYPSSRGFAYVLFETPLSPFDWGIKRVTRVHRNRQILDFVERLVARHHPETLVCEKLSLSGARRASRVADLYLTLGHYAQAHGINFVRYDRKAVLRCFAEAGAKTKPEIAFAIATLVPAFRHRLPPVRKLWASVDERQSLFDAAALALTHYATSKSADDP